MTKLRTNPEVDWYFSKAKKWKEESEKLRTIVLHCGLTEELKWGKPCYTFQKSNIVLIHAFKEYCALLFFKGALLKDAKRILIQQAENVQAARQIRFTSVGDIVKMEPTLKAYINEAIEVEKAGLEVIYKETSEFFIAEELRKKFDESYDLKTAFDALTPGRQREYLLYFSAAKQTKTRALRVQKCSRQILNGKGLNGRRQVFFHSPPMPPKTKNIRQPTSMAQQDSQKERRKPRFNSDVLGADLTAIFAGRRCRSFPEAQGLRRRLGKRRARFVLDLLPSRF